MKSNELRPGSLCHFENISQKDKWFIIELFLKAGAGKGIIIKYIENKLYSLDEFKYIYWHPMTGNVTVKRSPYSLVSLVSNPVHNVYDLLGAGEPTPNPWEIDCELQ